jgi:hypothetical protein
MAKFLKKINHIVELMLENRSFDHMLGYLYAGNNNKSPAGHDFDGPGRKQTRTISGDRSRCIQLKRPIRCLISCRAQILAKASRIPTTSYFRRMTPRCRPSALVGQNGLIV